MGGGSSGAEKQGGNAWTPHSRVWGADRDPCRGVECPGFRAGSEPHLHIDPLTPWLGHECPPCPEAQVTTTVPQQVPLELGAGRGGGGWGQGWPPFPVAAEGPHWVSCCPQVPGGPVRLPAGPGTAEGQHHHRLHTAGPALQAAGLGGERAGSWPPGGGVLSMGGVACVVPLSPPGGIGRKWRWGWPTRSVSTQDRGRQGASAPSPPGTVLAPREWRREDTVLSARPGLWEFWGEARQGWVRSPPVSPTQGTELQCRAGRGTLAQR